MKRVLIVTFAILATGCGTKKSTNVEPVVPNGFELTDGEAFFVNVEWQDGPKVCENEESQSVAILTILDGDKQTPSQITDVTVRPWMKIHGHGTGRWQPVVTAEKGHPNKYTITNLCFIMSGPWELNISASVDGTTDTIEWPLQVP